jgi:hypothetical protein
MGDVLKAYFVPNGSYLMEMAEDGEKVSAVETLQAIGREIRDGLRPDTIVVASPHWLPKSAFFVDDSAQHESFNDYPLRPAPFGRRFFSYSAAGDPVLARAIVASAREAGVPADTKVYGFDHLASSFSTRASSTRWGTPPLPSSRRRRRAWRDERGRDGVHVRRASQGGRRARHRR